MIPAPTFIHYLENESRLDLSKGLEIINNSFSSYCTEVFNQRISKKKNKIIKIVLEKKELIDYNYTLYIADNTITLNAGNEEDIILGLTTIYNLYLENALYNKMIIKDKALYNHRSLSFDSARHFFTIKELEKIIEEMSLIKLNVLHWHLSDDQGFRFESKKFPKLMSPQFYSIKEIESFLYYCKVRGILVIPEIDMPGHVSAILSSYPEYSCFEMPIQVGELAGIYETVLCLGKGKTYTFANELLKEIIDVFKCKTIHLGNDEVPKYYYKQCPHCNKIMKENNLNNYEELQGYFLKRISENLDINIIIWNDVLSGQYIPKNCTVQFWLNETPELKKYNLQNRPIIDSNMYHFYFDYPLAIIPLKRVFQYKSKFKNTIGLEACIWTERIKDNQHLEEMLFPRLYAFAEASWDNNKNYQMFLHNLSLLPKRVNQYNVIKKTDRLHFWKEFLNTPTVQGHETNKTSLKSQLDFFFYFMKLSDLKLIKQLKEKNK